MELAQRNIYRDARWDTLPTEWLLAAAKQGNEKAQIRIVELIQAGLYMEANWGDLPIAWLIAAAQNNNEAAQAHLGAKLAEGETLDLPEEIATDYLIVAAKQGNEEAQGELLTAAKNGNELAKKKLQTKKALEHAFAKGAWKRETDEETFRALLPYAEADIAAAQKLLADHYWYGWGVPQSREKAQEWYRRAAKNEDVYSQWWLE